MNVSVCGNASMKRWYFVQRKKKLWKKKCTNIYIWCRVLSFVAFVWCMVCLCYSLSPEWNMWMNLVRLYSSLVCIADTCVCEREPSLLRASVLHVQLNEWVKISLIGRTRIKKMMFFFLHHDEIGFKKWKYSKWFIPTPMHYVVYSISHRHLSIDVKEIDRMKKMQ